MDYLNSIIIEDIFFYERRFFDNAVVMSNEMYSNIVESINLNYFLLILTLGCFSSILCSIRNENRYKLIENSQPVHAQTIEIKPIESDSLKKVDV